MQNKPKVFTAIGILIGSIFSTFILQPFQVFFDLNVQKAVEAKGWDLLLSKCIDNGECGGDIIIVALENVLIFLSNPYVVGFAFGAVVFAIWDPVARFIKKDKTDETLDKLLGQVSLSNRLSYHDYKTLKEGDFEFTGGRVSGSNFVFLKPRESEKVIAYLAMSGAEDIFLTATYWQPPELHLLDKGELSVTSDYGTTQLPQAVRVKLLTKDRAICDYTVTNNSGFPVMAEIKIEGTTL